MGYPIRFHSAPDLAAPFDSADWADAPVLSVAVPRPEGSGHRPRVDFKLQYDHEGLYGLFDVTDRFVRCTARSRGEFTCVDSCVEFFVQPAAGVGYNNFEINAAGTLFAQHVDHHRRDINGFAAARLLTDEELELVRIFHTYRGEWGCEEAGPVDYRVGFFLPFSLFGRTNGAPVPVPGTVWYANVYKCGDETSHPHWLSWCPLRRLSFHEPDCFAPLLFL